MGPLRRTRPGRRTPGTPPRRAPPPAWYARLHAPAGDDPGLRTALAVEENPRWRPPPAQRWCSWQPVSGGGPRSRLQPAARPPALWLVQALTGTPTVAGAPLRGELRVGGDGVIETTRSSTVRLSASGVGMVDLGPERACGSCRPVKASRRLALDSGSSAREHLGDARRASPSTRASATALDLGCSYTLEADARGSGRLRVTLGWVGLGQHEVESLVPQGAVCALRPGPARAPRTSTTRPVLWWRPSRRLTARRTGCRPRRWTRRWSPRRPRDAFTLWHLLRRAEGPQAVRLYERLAALSPPPAG